MIDVRGLPRSLGYDVQHSLHGLGKLRLQPDRGVVEHPSYTSWPHQLHSTRRKATQTLFKIVGVLLGRE